MRISIFEQESDTYMLWRPFYLPTEHGPRHAIAVTNFVGKVLTSTYTILLAKLITDVWTIVLGTLIFLILHKGKENKPHPLLPTLWNSLSDLTDSVLNGFKYTEKDGSEKDRYQGFKPASFWALLLLTIAAWAARNALSIIIPPLLIIGNAAPVNPNAIYIPGQSDRLGENAIEAIKFALNAPWALRALAGADVANKRLQEKIKVRNEPQGQWENGESILRLDYEYNVTGKDFGLQRYPDLLFQVNGSCVTEYKWFIPDNITYTAGDSVYHLDNYILFPNSDNETKTQASLFDGPKPSAQFFNGKIPVVGRLEKSNATWAAVISSVDRSSYTEGTDPWYLTDLEPNNKVHAKYKVRRGRPALSCWEDNVWNYGEQSVSVSRLGNNTLPGFNVSDGMLILLTRYLFTPMIQTVGSHVGPSALKSTTSAVGQTFDAEESSFLSDFKRLVLASYIATVKTLVDSTLYPENASCRLPNDALEEDGKLMKGIGAFVIESSDVSALSLRIIIIIPSLVAGIWILRIILIEKTPLRIANSLDAGNLFEFMQKHQDMVPFIDEKDGPTWRATSKSSSAEENVGNTALYSEGKE